MYRRIKQILKSTPTMEGAGVRLKRVFGYHQVPLFDPFLLLDHFGSGNPDDYIKGFPWHPHRGIETVTYMIRGAVEHGDSIGNTGVINSGDIQWMTAGNGIIHQEMPKVYEGMMQGFQLWVNLPSNHKMIDPRYRGIRADQIPIISLENDITIKIISGKVKKAIGPVRDLVVNVEYLDVSIPANIQFNHPVMNDYKAFVYIFEGNGFFDEHSNKLIERGNCIIYKDGDKIRIKAGDQGIRFLLISGKPIGETIAWSGPIVMNTQEELAIAYEEYQNGTFIKNR